MKLRYAIPKQISAVLVAVICLVTGMVPASAATPDELEAEAIVLMEAETGQVLYAKNPRQRMYPASITKIMTAMLALEHLDPEDSLTASAQAVDLPSWGSSADIQSGEVLTVAETLYALMLPSANEAGNVLAEAVSGSFEDFADLMNERAAELGATGTHFSNAHGLPTRSPHYTTAYDMALITRQAIETPGFLTYFGAGSYTIPATNLHRRRNLTNVHRMLRPDDTLYNPDVIGGKTGYTMQAGYTLVTVAHREGRTLICVVMKDTDRYEDTKALLEYGFSDFSPITYDFSKEEPFSAFLRDEELGEVMAVFQLPGSVELLLPEGTTPGDLWLKYDHQLLVDSREESWANVEILLEQAGQEPLALLSIPLELSSWEFEPIAPVEIPIEEIPKEQEKLPFPFVPVILVLCGLCVAGICVIAWLIKKR